MILFIAVIFSIICNEIIYQMVQNGLSLCDNIRQRKIGASKVMIASIVILLFLLIGLVFTAKIDEITAAKYIVLFISGVYIVDIDRKEMKIPNLFLLYLCILRALFFGIEITQYKWETVLEYYGLGALLALVIMLIVYFFSRKGIGEGDIKLFTVIGLYVGVYHVLPILFVMAIMSLIFGVVMLLLKKMTLKTEIPYAPFIIGSVIIYIIVLHFNGGII